MMVMLKNLMSKIAKHDAPAPQPATSPLRVDMSKHAPVSRCSVCANLVETRVLKDHTAACASYSAYCFDYDGGQKCTSCGERFASRHESDAHLAALMKRVPA